MECFPLQSRVTLSTSTRLFLQQLAVTVVVGVRVRARGVVRVSAWLVVFVLVTGVAVVLVVRGGGGQQGSQARAGVGHRRNPIQTQFSVSCPDF